MYINSLRSHGDDLPVNLPLFSLFNQFRRFFDSCSALCALRTETKTILLRTIRLPLSNSTEIWTECTNSANPQPMAQDSSLNVPFAWAHCLDTYQHGIAGRPIAFATTDPIAETNDSVSDNAVATKTPRQIQTNHNHRFGCAPGSPSVSCRAGGPPLSRECRQI